MTALALAALLALGANPKVPVPRAEAELLALRPFLAGYCGRIEGDPETFRLAVLPFAPLDLQVRKAKDHDEANALRNFYLGLAGAACKVDSAKLAGSFHCGPDCTRWRRGQLVTQLPELKSLAAAFQRLKGVWLVAQWAVPGEYRVNDLFRMMGGQTNEALPSTTMGLVPSEAWRPWPDDGSFFAGLGAKQAEVEAVVGLMRRLSIAAAVREHEGVRLVKVGILDDEGGVLFLPSGAAGPKRGEKGKDGREFVVVEPLEPGVVLYETR
jgi:hypothetical protein